MFSFRLNRATILVLLIVLFLLLINHYHISKFASNEAISRGRSFATSKIVNLVENFDKYSAKYHTREELELIKDDETQVRTQDMLRIKNSVVKELQMLESELHKIQSEKNSDSSKLENLKYKIAQATSELSHLLLSIESGKSQLQELKEAYSKDQIANQKPLVFMPFQRHKFKMKLPKPSLDLRCSISKCFDYSRCPLTSSFSTFTYSSLINQFSDEKSVGLTVISNLIRNHHNSYDPFTTCIYFVVINVNGAKNVNISLIQSKLQNLDHWSNDGKNHVLINLNPLTDLTELGLRTKHSLLVQSTFKFDNFRRMFDVVLPPLINLKTYSTTILPSLCPAKRKYLVTFRDLINVEESDELAFKLFSKLKELESIASSKVFFDLNCDSSCLKDSSDSTFAIVLPPLHDSYDAFYSVSEKILTMIAQGVIPILVDGSDIHLPFDEVIDWRKALIMLPSQRLPELIMILRSIPDMDVLERRRQGKMVFDRYFSSLPAILNSLVSLFRHRFNFPSPSLNETEIDVIHNSSFSMKILERNEFEPRQEGNEPEEILGPIEAPFPSPKFLRNFSLLFFNEYDLWNDFAYDPFYTYPNLPFDPVLPGDAKFLGSNEGFRPIGDGWGGSGKEFSEALGGNYPKEQFTILMLTYEREKILLKSLERLKRLPFLNKVIVIWNNPMKKPSADIVWPDLGVPLQITAASKNSLNNRFKPYKEIETEAILSIDDDAHLRHDEIIFGFRVWREARDRIVGFPGRYHAWDREHSSWLYNSNYSCELSMVLTGAAFFHKYYTYLYTYSMDDRIRKKVDEFMNCEDLAMNFLVSHVTRKPPLKVTSRWTFRCPECDATLSEDDTHFIERHKCINYFTHLYGYNPLLQTQFRVDSVLFKTRIARDKQKCFKYI